MSEPKVGDFVLNYQRFTDEDDPLPPFLCRIVRETVLLYFVEHLNIKGIIKKRRINKGCCSSNAINPQSVMPDYEVHFNSVIRNRIKADAPKPDPRSRSVVKPRKRRVNPISKEVKEVSQQRIRLKI
jgi:hypothetical protein